MIKLIPFKFIAFIGFLEFCHGAEYLTEKPIYIQTCALSDPNFISCSTQQVSKLFTQLRSGIPGLKNFPNIEPFHISKVQISQDTSQVVNLKADLTNVNVSGFGNVIVKESIVKASDLSWDTKLFMPKVRIDSLYDLSGRILLIPLNGKGKMFIEIENMDVVMHTKTKLYEKGGFKFYEILSVKIDYVIDGLKTRFDNLFNGNKELEDSTNQFFNQNWKDLNDALKPVVRKTVSEIFFDITKKVFEFIPADFFISDLPNVGN